MTLALIIVIILLSVLVVFFRQRAKGWEENARYFREEYIRYHGEAVKLFQENLNLKANNDLQKRG